MTLTEKPTAAPALPSKQPEDDGPRLSLVFGLVFAVGGMAIGLRPLHDNSFMWHLRTGRWILDHGIPYHDPYSYTAHGAKWVAQSWLAELLYGVVNRFGGAFGLRLLGGVVGFVIGWLLYRSALYFARDRVRAGAITLLTMACLLNVWSERPLMLGILAMLLVTVIAEIPDAWISRRPLIALPIVMWLWTNVHGTFIIGFGYLALHLIGRTFEGHPITRGRERDLFRGTAIAAAVTIINPYGLDLLLFPLRLMGRGQVLRDVAEWQSPNFRELGGAMFAVFIVVTLVLFARKKVGVRDVLVTIVFLGLGLWAVRNIGLAVVVVSPVLARCARNASPRPDERKSIHRVMVGALVLTVVLGVVHAKSQDNWHLNAYPVAAYDELLRLHLEDRHLYTTDAWGGYVIARDKQPVFFDDRYDMYPIKVNNDYGAIAGVTDDWQKTLDEYQVDVVMWPTSSPLVRALKTSPVWVQVPTTDERAVLFVRRGVLPA
jgi:hypothetical protein